MVADRPVGQFPWMAAAYAVTLLAGLLFVASAVWEADQRMRSDTLHHIRLLARSFSLADVRRLNGVSSEADLPGYRRLKEQLAALRATDPKCRLLYLLSWRSGGKVVFLADSVPMGMKDESPIGKEYGKAAGFLQAFDEKTELTIGPSRDSWGTGMSSLVLLSAPDPGAATIIMGIDADAMEWWREIRNAGAVPLLLSFLLLAVLAGGRLLLTLAARGKGSRSRRGEAVLVTGVGVVLTAAAVWMAHDRVWRSYREAFAQLADAEFSNAVGVFQTLCNQELEGLARYFKGSQDIRPDEFRVYTEYLVKNPAIQAWEWLPAVPSNEVARFEADFRATGQSDFMVWGKDADGKRVPVAGRSVYFPITYVVPYEGNERALGYEPASNPQLSQVMELAKRDQLPKMTPPIRLVQEIGSQKGAVVYLPVFSGGHSGPLRGYVASVLRLGSFLQQITIGQNPDHPYMTVELLVTEEGEAPQVVASTSVEHNARGYSETRFLSIFGRTFAFRMHPERAFSELHPLHAPWMVALAGGGLTAVVAILVGLTVRQRHDLELLVDQRTRSLVDSEEVFRRLFSKNPVPVALSCVDDQRFVNVNEAFLATLGYVREEVIGATPGELGMFPDTGRFIRLMKEFTGKGSLDPVEFEIRHKNGAVLYALFSGEVVRIRETLHYLTVMVDITPLKRAEAERLRLVTAIEQASEIIAVTDTRGVIQYANPAFEAITGFSSEEVLGKTFAILNSGTQSPAFYREMWDTIRSGKTWAGRFINKRKDGVLYTEEATISPVRDEAGAVVNYVVVKRDITHELKLERQFMQAQKMELVGRLAGGVAHDFNNMLGVILGYTEMALTKISPANPLYADLMAVQESAWRTADLTRQLLAFARKQTVLPRILDLNTVVDSAIRMLGRLIGENIRLEWQPSNDLWPVRMDPSQIDQLLTNFCVNSRDAISGVGRIIMRTDNVILDQDFCADHEGACPGDYVMLSVADTGCGMSAEVLAHVFEPFYTTKGVGEGTGLGLATVYGIVKQNQGFISAESQPGRGATFRIYLPRHTGAVAAPTHDEASIEAIRGNETILLVEDDVAVLGMTRQMMTTLGYHVLAIGNPQEAIAVARERRGGIHLMLVDVVMPEMNGPELVRQIQLFCPDMRAIFTSSYPPSVVSRNGVPGNCNFIQKPFSLNALATALREVLQKSA